MRLFMTGGSGVIGWTLQPRAEEAGHGVIAPGPDGLDLFDADAVAAAVASSDAVLHLATHIPPREKMREPKAWQDNDRLRTEAARILVDAALAAGVSTYVQPTVTFVYPEEEPADEDTPVGDVAFYLRSALVAEQETARFAESGRGVALRFGLLDGPGTGHDEPDDRLGATLHVADAAEALLKALAVPSGIYNVCRDGERVSNERFQRASGWRPTHDRAPTSRP